MHDVITSIAYSYDLLRRDVAHSGKTWAVREAGNGRPGLQQAALVEPDLRQTSA